MALLQHLSSVVRVPLHVAGKAAGLVGHASLAQPVEGARDLAEYASLPRVEELLSPTAPLGRAVAIGERQPDAVLRPEDAAAVRPAWDQIVTLISGKLVFRD